MIHKLQKSIHQNQHFVPLNQSLLLPMSAGFANVLHSDIHDECQQRNKA